MQLRQEQLEREEEAKAQLNEDTPSIASFNNSKNQQQAPSVARKAPRPGFVVREKAKIQLHIRKVKAIARKRMPVQVRVLTEVSGTYHSISGWHYSH